MNSEREVDQEIHQSLTDVYGEHTLAASQEIVRASIADDQAILTVCTPDSVPTAIDPDKEAEDDDYVNTNKPTWAKQCNLLNSAADCLMLDDPLDFPILVAIAAKIKAKNEELRATGSQSTINKYFPTGAPCSNQ